MRLKIIFCYDGSEFYGYQVQTKEDERSVQLELEKILSKILNTEIKLVASGRTDRGVHALKQVAHFDVQQLKMDLGRLTHSVNCLLPEDIHVKTIENVEDSFHARFSVKEKKYRYQIYLGEYSPFFRKFAWQLRKELDIEKMKEAAKYFVGKHSFHNFCSNDDDFVRKIYEISIEKRENWVYLDFSGNGFRRYMVRMIVGTLVEIGLNRLSINKIPYYLNECINDRISYKAPAEGLYLYDVIY